MKETILEKVKKLLNHAESAKRSGSLQEAETFLKKANELLIKHNLSMFEVRSSEKEEEFVFSDHISYKDHWKLNLAATLAKSNMCSIVGYSHSKSFKLFGEKDNLDMVVYMINFAATNFENLARREYEEYKQLILDLNEYTSPKQEIPNKRAYINSWLVGAAHGLYAKLKEQEKEIIAQHNTYSLMVVKNEEKLKREMENRLGDKIHTKRLNNSVSSRSAYDSGFSTGKDFTMGKPLSNPNRKLLN